MFGQTFYHKTLRKYVTLFGTLFNDIYINRVDGDGAVVDTLKVPIYYGPKQKTLSRLDQDPLLNRPFKLILPRMSFEMTGIQYDSARKLTTTNKGFVKDNPSNPDQQKYLYNPVPYNIGFDLNIMVKNAEDGTKILEQILPFFTPDWTTTVNLISDLDVKMDIPTVIGNVTVEDSYEGPVEERRVLIWTISFTMKGYLFGPIRKSEIIKLSSVNFFNDNIEDPAVLETVSLQPGLLANGSPTTNASITIDKSLIESTDDWDYITIKESNI